MTQDELWNRRYQEYMDYMAKHKRRPSKYNPELRHLIYWLKANKRLLAAGKMQAARVARFTQLLQTAHDFRRINQYAYVAPPVVQLSIEF